MGVIKFLLGFDTTTVADELAMVTDDLEVWEHTFLFLETFLLLFLDDNSRIILLLIREPFEVESAANESTS